MRGDILKSNNVRINTAKPFISKNKKNKSIREFNKTMNDSIVRNKDNLNRIKSSKDYNKKLNLEINDKWKNNNKYINITAFQTLSTIENQIKNNIEKDNSNKSIQNIKLLTTELTDSVNNNNIDNTNNSNLNKSNISSKIENQFEEQKNMDIKDKNELNNENNSDNSQSSEFNDSYQQFKILYTKQLKSHQKKKKIYQN